MLYLHGTTINIAFIAQYTYHSTCSTSTKYRHIKAKYVSFFACFCSFYRQQKQNEDNVTTNLKTQFNNYMYYIPIYQYL